MCFSNSEGEMVKLFIDTNVFVHWIILTEIKRERPDDKELWTKFKKIKPSFEVLEMIKNNSITGFTFFTSPLSLSEIFYSLLDEYRCRHMYRDGVPLSSWQKTRDRFILTGEEIKELTTDVINFLNEFDIFKPLSTNKKVHLLTTEHVDYNLISKLILEKKFRTHDAVLISTAINSGCQYFTTEDKIIRDSKLDGIAIISPEKLLQIIKGNNESQMEAVKKLSANEL